MECDGWDSRLEKGDVPRRLRELYNALTLGNKNEVIEEYETLVLAGKESPLTTLGDTVLHIAFHLGHKEILEEMVSKVTPDDLIKKNKNGDTILHEAATTDMTGVVEKVLDIVSKNDTQVVVEKVFEIVSEKDTVLYEAATTDTTEVGVDLLSKRNKLGETPLFRAAHFGQTQMFLYLAGCIEKKQGGSVESDSRRKDGTTALHIAIVAGFYDTALMIAKEYPKLTHARDETGATGLHLLSTISTAFKSGIRLGLVKRLIYYCIPIDDIDGPHGSHPDRKISDEENVVPHGSHQDRITSDEENAGSRSSKLCQTYNTYLHSEFNGPVLQKINQMIWDHLPKGWPLLEEIREEKRKHESAIKLAKVLINRHTSWMESNTGGEQGKVSILKKREKKEMSEAINANLSPDQKDCSRLQWTPQLDTSLPVMPLVETPLLVATGSGTVEIVNELLEKYPQAVEHISPIGQNILHVAVKNRQKAIFDLVIKKKIPLERLTRRIDYEGNTILHQVAFVEEHYRGECPAVLLQDELLWFERVKNTLLTPYVMHRNKDGLTAEELFTQSHKKLLQDAQEWLKHTSESCSLVAILIATVAFAAAYTVPGGLDQTTGLPILLHQPFFLVFTVMDVLSLTSSLTSVVMFLSILTSPFRLRDFHQSLPGRLTLGLTLLFLSVATMMLALAATVILTIHVKGTWATLIYAVAFIPVSIFALLQLPLYVSLLAAIEHSLKVISKALPRWK